MNITGKTMIFKSEYGYSTAISNKNQDGTFDKMYLSVQFPKGVEIQNKSLINIKESFLSFYKTKEGFPKPKIVIMNYELLTTQENIDNYNNTVNFENDLPF